MNATLMNLLACPDCGALLTRRERALLCPAGHGAGDLGGRPPFRIEGGIPRLLPAGATPPNAQRTVAAFERQWDAYGDLRRIFGKDADAMAANLHGPRMGDRIDSGWYRGRRVLDAGCGHGRYLPAFAALGADVVGLDIGRGPELAGVPLDNPHIDVVQGSVLAPPFREGSFDLVFSDGVIHHTPDAKAAYLALARLVKPG